MSYLNSKNIKLIFLFYLISLFIFTNYNLGLEKQDNFQDETKSFQNKEFSDLASQPFFFHPQGGPRFYSQEDLDKKINFTRFIKAPVAGYIENNTDINDFDEKAEIQHIVVRQEVENGRKVQGHVLIVEKPWNHFSIVEPENGCGNGRASPQDSATAYSKRIFNVSSSLDQNHDSSKNDNTNSNKTNEDQDQIPSARQDFQYYKKCRVTTNAGFYNINNEDCIGNVISDSQNVQTTDRTNVNFGITQNGEYIIGYLTPSEVESMNFQQLVAGVVWIVRNGVEFVDQSARVEDMDSQTNGDNFVSLFAPRLAIGHDDHGRMILLAIDGEESNGQGASLYNMAQLIRQFGAKNAINLDGGGSVTTMLRDIVLNYPTHPCPKNPSIPYSDLGVCPRPTTTIVCIHDNIKIHSNSDDDNDNDNDDNSQSSHEHYSSSSSSDTSQTKDDSHDSDDDKSGSNSSSNKDDQDKSGSSNDSSDNTNSQSNPLPKEYKTLGGGSSALTFVMGVLALSVIVSIFVMFRQQFFSARIYRGMNRAEMIQQSLQEREEEGLIDTYGDDDDDEDDNNNRIQ